MVLSRLVNIMNLAFSLGLFLCSVSYTGIAIASDIVDERSFPPQRVEDILAKHEAEPTFLDYLFYGGFVKDSLFSSYRFEVEKPGSELALALRAVNRERLQLNERLTKVLSYGEPVTLLTKMNDLAISVKELELTNELLVSRLAQANEDLDATLRSKEAVEVRSRERREQIKSLNSEINLLSEKVRVLGDEVQVYQQLTSGGNEEEGTSLKDKLLNAHKELSLLKATAETKKNDEDREEALLMDLLRAIFDASEEEGADVFLRDRAVFLTQDQLYDPNLPVMSELGERVSLRVALIVGETLQNESSTLLRIVAHNPIGEDLEGLYPSHWHYALDRANALASFSIENGIDSSFLMSSATTFDPPFRLGDGAAASDALIELQLIKR